MGRMSWHESQRIAQSQGTFFTTYDAAKTVINTEDLRTYAADFWCKGRGLWLNVAGAISNIVTTPGTIVFQVKLGSVVVWTSGNIQMNAIAHTKFPFWLEVLLTCRSVGSGTSATFIGQGKVSGKMFTNTAAQVDGLNSDSVILVPATSPAVGNGFDSTAAQQLDFFTGFSINNVGNGIQIEQYVPTELN